MKLSPFLKLVFVGGLIVLAGLGYWQGNQVPKEAPPSGPGVVSKKSLQRVTLRVRTVNGKLVEAEDRTKGEPVVRRYDLRCLLAGDLSLKSGDVLDALVCPRQPGQRLPDAAISAAKILNWQAEGAPIAFRYMEDEADPRFDYHILFWRKQEKLMEDIPAIGRLFEE
ncbi:hypothetical protein [Verrucomicrobium sp. BvORR034]|uniref:hypothetical protein n=1 Tax=Verrucomicrobium sp. BvORR034 TaxID=1396418 RepID=UPI000678ECEC|nr:hypothetical protein [Verrucomicrobium sp. BvORR034]